MRAILSAAAIAALVVTFIPVLAGPPRQPAGAELQFGNRRPQQPRNFPRPQPPKLVTVGTSYDIPLAEDVRVRTLKLGERFDNQGNVIDPSRLPVAEQQKLKGSTPDEQKLPGYKADLVDLKVGQIVEVFLVYPRRTPAAPTVRPVPKVGEEGSEPPAKPPPAPVSTAGATRVTGKLAALASNQITLRLESQVLQPPNMPVPKAQESVPVTARVANVIVIVDATAEVDAKKKKN
jgi:hypothetical protein